MRSYGLSKELLTLLPLPATLFHTEISIASLKGRVKGIQAISVSEMLQSMRHFSVYCISDFFIFIFELLFIIFFYAILIE